MTRRFVKMENMSIANRVKNLINKRRVCGPCKECCTVMGVEEILKPNRFTCEHLVDKDIHHCGIYHDRPTSCKLYNCAWRYDMVGNQEDRPDKIGAIFDGGQYEGIAWWVVYVIGDEISERAAELIDKLTDNHPVLVRFKDVAKLHAHPWHYRKWPNLNKAIDAMYGTPRDWEIKARQKHNIEE